MKLFAYLDVSIHICMHALVIDFFPEHIVTYHPKQNMHMHPY